MLVQVALELSIDVSRTLASRRKLGRGGSDCLLDSRRNSRTIVARVQRYSRERPLGEAVRHRERWLD